VFIHGWTLSSAIWSVQIEALASQGLRAIAYDRRGHGQSSKPETGYDYETLAGDLAALLDQARPHDVVLVGPFDGRGEVVRYLRAATARTRRA
jgi:pimeloyl-ACP methyl ester carboxylesterase